MLLFRRIDGYQIRALPMGERAASRAVQRAVARVGLVGKYSSHSLRAGLCTSAYVAGRTLREIGDPRLRAGHHVAHAARTHAHALRHLAVTEPAQQFLSKYLACLAHW